MRTPLIAVIALAVAAPLAAQGSMAGMNMDPTNKINGSGKLPDGWMMRFDPVMVRAGQPVPAPHQMSEVDVTKSGSGIHFHTGPAAVYYNTKDMASGEYTVSAKFAQTATMTHEAYGIFIGGSNLQDSTQMKYIYFVIRPSDAGAMIQMRNGLARPAEERGVDPNYSAVFGKWNIDMGVNKDAPGTGAATNELSIKVGKDAVQFMANGKVVKEIPRAVFNGMSTDGQVGLRVNHNLNIQVDGFAIKK
jgi:hypothetical protein